ncbi:MAG: iron chelate uptake ABC transporter family permease subunit [Propionibacteriaceae bacterium]|nr:iron chelate uptake ABC transporter family permease subunit [Propionibacteriaceae bacterium]
MNRARRRRAVILLALGLAGLGLAVVALGVGDYPLTPAQVLAALTGQETGFAHTVVVDWRAPRVTVALAFGAALAVSGALFQSLTRNPLGSPDVIGLSTGSYTGALVAAAWLGSGRLASGGGALIGGLVTAGLVYALARRDGVQGFRLIVVGIGVTAMLHAFNLFLLMRLREEVAMTAAIWGAGSIGLIGWDQALPAIVALALAAPLVVACAPGLRQLELGDDAAGGHGLRVEPTRLAILALGAGLTAIVTASAGPIAFISLAAPQIAQRLTRSAGTPLLASALLGGAGLLAADLVAQFALPIAVPTGAVTVVLGGAYLVDLMIREARRSQ